MFRGSRYRARPASSTAVASAPAPEEMTSMSPQSAAGPHRWPRSRIAAAAAVTAAVPAAVLAVTVWPSEAATTPVGNGVYTLASGASGKCVDVVGASLANSAPLAQAACAAGATHLQWKVLA